MHRKDLHLADWDGDGDCDIIHVDPDRDNAIEVWLNKDPGSWEWEYLANPAPGVTCSEKRGIGLHDLAVQFADLTGNKRADYLCIKPSGQVSAFLHPGKGGGAWEDAGQIKFAEGKERANLRWADVDGDGLDDMIWIEKFSGDSWVWYNGGRGSPSTGGGSSFYWRRQDKKAYAGLAAGACIFYADLNGDGRADEHYVLESFNNIARTSLSPSCGLTDAAGDDDDGNMHDIHLPTPPATRPEHCTGGTGPQGLGDLCQYACQFDNCLPPCECTATGDLRTAPAPDTDPGKAAPGQPDGVGRLCAFACSRRFCPKSSCESGEDKSQVCDGNDPQDASAWEDSGAASLVDNYIQTSGYDDWLRRADAQYHLGAVNGGLNCDNLFSLHCPAPDSACADWSPPAFWYVRHMASRITEHFNIANDLLLKKSIGDLALVDGMVKDFQAEPPAEAELKKILTNLSGAAGLASALIGSVPVVGSAGATIFSILGGVVSMANVESKDEPQDLEQLKVDAKKYIRKVLESSSEILQRTLKAFFGNGDTKVLVELYDKLRSAKIIKDSYRATEVGKALDGGEFLVPVDHSAIATSFDKGFNSTTGAILGHMLTALHYMVVFGGLGADSERYCAQNPACRVLKWTEECQACEGDIRHVSACYYLIRRPKGKRKSETVPAEDIGKLKETYTIDIADLFDNVRLCNNRKPDKDMINTIYAGPDPYPPCHFGLPHVQATSGYMIYINNPEDLPDWITAKEDYWKAYTEL